MGFYIKKQKERTISIKNSKYKFFFNNLIVDAKYFKEVRQNFTLTETRTIFEPSLTYTGKHRLWLLQ